MNYPTKTAVLTSAILFTVCYLIVVCQLFLMKTNNQ